MKCPVEPNHVNLYGLVPWCPYASQVTAYCLGSMILSFLSFQVDPMRLPSPFQSMDNGMALGDVVNDAVPAYTSHTLTVWSCDADPIIHAALGFHWIRLTWNIYSMDILSYHVPRVQFMELWCPRWFNQGWTIGWYYHPWRQWRGSYHQMGTIPNPIWHLTIYIEYTLISLDHGIIHWKFLWFVDIQHTNHTTTTTLPYEGYELAISLMDS